MQIDDKVLASLWDNANWQAIEEKLMQMQKQLCMAAKNKESAEVKRLQKQIVMNSDFKMLAVRKVTTLGQEPGVDGIVWQTSAEKMKAANSLTSRGYKASPVRRVILKGKRGDKDRFIGISTHYDRAMSVLYGYSLLPVVETLADKKSFAFRRGRSLLDAHEYVMSALMGKDAPEYVLKTDVKSFYASIQHKWLIEHAPMDKKVLEEMLSAGVVFAGELFPPEDKGINLGSSISPYLGNFALDGLQSAIYRGIYGSKRVTDYANGNMIRFADDIIVTVRSEKDGERALQAIKSFLEVRGLSIATNKTYINLVEDGFTFLNRRYIKTENQVICKPDERAVDLFLNDLQDTIENHRKSQRNLIETLNHKIHGFAGYHRYSHAVDTFARMDVAIDAMLLQKYMKKNNGINKDALLEKYWYQENKIKYFSLPDERSVRLYKLSDTVLIRHKKVRASYNPFLDSDGYIESRVKKRDINNVNGSYLPVWRRQNGCCFYCKRPILSDQERLLVPVDLTEVFTVKNAAYIHSICDYGLLHYNETKENELNASVFDKNAVFKEVVETINTQGKKKKQLPKKWKHNKLKEYFSHCTKARITLTFADIEEIEGGSLPKSAYKQKYWWYPSKASYMICDAWVSEGYELYKLDIENQVIVLSRIDKGKDSLVIPKKLQSKIPENAKYELEEFMAYIIKKYGL